MLGAVVVVGLVLLGAALLFVAYRRRAAPAPRPAPGELQQVADDVEATEAELARLRAAHAAEVADVREDVRDALTHEPTADEVRATLARIRTRPR